MSWMKKAQQLPAVEFMLKKLVTYKANKEASDIAKHFITYLKPSVANTDELKTEVFRIRHDVYCEELAFEAVRENGLETDEFDQQSIFSILEHKPSHRFSGTVRIVAPVKDDECMPIEKYCSDAITEMDIHPRNLKRTEICEISRLAVRSEFRRRKSDKHSGAATGAINEEVYSEEELRCFPFIAIGLYMSAASMAIDLGIKHVFVMMEPRLARSMGFVGIKFRKIGPTIEYHGKRAPYYINPQMFFDNLSPGFRVLYKTIAKDVSKQLAAMQASGKLVRSVKCDNRLNLTATGTELDINNLPVLLSSS